MKNYKLELKDLKARIKARKQPNKQACKGCKSYNQRTNICIDRYLPYEKPLCNFK